MKNKMIISGLILFVLILIPIIYAGLGQETHGLQYTIIGSGTQAGVTINVTSNFTLINVTKWSPDVSDRVTIFNVTIDGVNGTILQRGYFTGDSANVSINLTKGKKYMIVTDKIDDSAHGIAYAPLPSTNLPISGDVLNWVNSSWQGLENGNGYNIWNIYSLTYTNNQLGANQTYFNVSTFQTSRENILANFTLDTAPTSATLYYGSASSPTTITNPQANVYVFSNSLDIPTDNINSSLFYWNITYPNGTIAKTNKYVQSVSPINLSICNFSGSQTYINFTFKNETTSAETIKGSIVSSTWNYFLGFGTSNKTLTYSNAVENSSYAFCFAPRHKTVTTTLTLDYDNAESEQRNFRLNSYPLSNSSLNQILYLLPSSLGLFSQFQVVTSAGTPISGAVGTITRSFGGGTITVTSAITDSSGLVSYFLNPDVTYTATFTATGYPSTTFTFTPSTSLRTVTMGSGLTGISNGTQISINTTYSILPYNSTLGNRTNVFFSFNVSSNQPINLISMNITNRSGYQVFFNSTAGTGFVTGTIFTGTNTTFIGKFTIATATETFTTQRIWTIGSTYIGDYSIFRQLSLFKQYQFSDFIRILLAITIILGAMYGLSKAEVIDTSESKIIVALMLVWTFSMFGWLDTNLTINSTNQGVTKLASLSSQYGIAIISSVLGAYFISKKT